MAVLVNTSTAFRVMRDEGRGTNGKTEQADNSIRHSEFVICRAS
jgi:hypothetical protein